MWGLHLGNLKCVLITVAVLVPSKNNVVLILIVAKSSPVKQKNNPIKCCALQ